METEALAILASRAAIRGDVGEARDLLRTAELAAANDEARLCVNEAWLQFFLTQRDVDAATRYALRQRRLLKRIIARGGDSSGLAFRLLIKNLYEFGPRSAARKTVLRRLSLILQLREPSQRPAMLMLESVVVDQFGSSSTLLRRIPKVVDLGDLDVLCEDGSTVHPDNLAAYGLISPTSRVHVTGIDKPTRALTVYAHSFTRRALNLIHATGGRARRLRYRRARPQAELPSE